MEVLNPNGQKIYNLTAGKILPDWIPDAKKRALKKDPEYRDRIELIQDFHFKSYCNRVKFSPNGGYPPTMKVYELSELSMKFERRIDADVIQFQTLSDDYSKLALLRADRTIEFHARFGTYYHTRIPKHGRDMMYDHATCDLITCGTGSEINRLNLDRGMFLKPMTSSCPGLNCCGINPQNALYAFGGEDGIAEFVDPRSRKPIAFLDVGEQTKRLMFGVLQDKPEITKLRFHNEGLLMTLGTSTGQVLLYDLRSNKPVHFRDHQFGTPIVDLKFQESSRNVVSSCKKIVKIWSQDDASLFTSIEPNYDINDVCVKNDYGLVFVAGETERIGAYYVPGIGPCPKWCAYIDNLTEQFEERNDMAIYTDYKFVTKEDLEALNVGNLVGTPYLRAYMHGFFIDKRLYDKVRALAKPDEFKEYRKERIKQKLEEKRASRISIAKVPAVNKELAQRAMALLGSSKESTVQHANEMLEGRFSRMFNDPAFAIDTSSQAYKLANPMGRKKSAEELELEAQFNEVKQDESAEEEFDENENPEDLISNSDDEDNDGDEDDDEGDEDDEDDGDEDEEEQNEDKVEDYEESVMKSKPKNQKEPSEKEPKSGDKRKLRFFEVKDNEINPLKRGAEEEARKKRKLELTSFAKRVEAEPSEVRDTTTFGAMSMTFVPNDVKEKRAKITSELAQRKVQNKGRRAMTNRMLGVKPAKKKY